VLVALGRLPRRRGRHRAGGDVNVPGPEPAQQFVACPDDHLQHPVVGKRAEDEGAGFNHLLRARHARRALRGQGGGPCDGTVPDGDGVACLEHVGSHRLAHVLTAVYGKPPSRTPRRSSYHSPDRPGRNARRPKRRDAKPPFFQGVFRRSRLRGQNRPAEARSAAGGPWGARQMIGPPRGQDSGSAVAYRPRNGRPEALRWRIGRRAPAKKWGPRGCNRRAPGHPSHGRNADG
jgi:hypothetical protein